MVKLIPVGAINSDLMTLNFDLYFESLYYCHCFGYITLQCYIDIDLSTICWMIYVTYVLIIFKLYVWWMQCAKVHVFLYK